MTVKKEKKKKRRRRRRRRGGDSVAGVQETFALKVIPPNWKELNAHRAQEENKSDEKEIEEIEVRITLKERTLRRSTCKIESGTEEFALNKISSTRSILFEGGRTRD